ncbi:hypothetical protein HHK36_019327 [Tetracentron sinense]|uniref:Uncharacterized protein n=1 Tax=Tetracentron sinense TaxID=13715 RepID=A0A834YZ21_TETSI|nr:hypothetical protein HHK36_019327 [Tetracentron sinense]
MESKEGRNIYVGERSWICGIVSAQLLEPGKLLWRTILRKDPWISCCCTVLNMGTPSLGDGVTNSAMGASG